MLNKIVKPLDFKQETGSMSSSEDGNDFKKSVIILKHTKFKQKS